MESPPDPGPLDGIVVADLSRVLAGPYAAMTLGDLGANVIKVERPDTGDDTRAWGPPWADDGSTYFQALNRNKRSIALDFTVREDLEVAMRIIRHSDVVIENFRPGSLARFGLDAEHSLAANPRLVYCSITGFGTSEDAQHLVGYDLLVQASSGLMSITGWPDGPPTKVGVALIDHVCALQAVVGVLAALRHRDRTGVGQHVSVSLMGAALAALLNQASGYLGAGVIPGRLGNRHPSIAPYQTFRASDGYFVLACGNDTQFAAVCAVTGIPDAASDPRFATNPERVDHVDALEDLLEQHFAHRKTHDIVTALTSVGVPAGPILDVAQAFAFASAIGLEAINEVEEVSGPVFRSVASPINLGALPTRSVSAPPRLDEHRDAVCAWLDGLEGTTPGT
ncbi:MAG TPA: CoA transferase [Acidimicrobiia bacterium]|nr:CoA transferase [Acidimicrobiia bacterium]